MPETPSHFFTLTYAPSDSQIAATYAELADKTVAEICRTFQFDETKLENKIDLILCKDVEDYILFTNKKPEDYQEWMVGFYDYPNRSICLLSPRAVTDRSEEELRQVLVHEIVHMIFDEYCGVLDNEAWVSEGIAILFAGQTMPEYVSVTEFPRIADIAGKCINGNTPDRFIDNGGYDYAGIYVQYFLEKFGFEEFLKVYKNQKDVSTYLCKEFEKQAVDFYFKHLQ